MPIRNYAVIATLTAQALLRNPDLALMQDIATFQSNPPAFEFPQVFFAYDKTRFAACMTSGHSAQITLEKQLADGAGFLEICTFDLNTVDEIKTFTTTFDQSTVFRVRKVSGDAPAWVRGW